MLVLFYYTLTSCFATYLNVEFTINIIMVGKNDNIIFFTTYFWLVHVLSVWRQRKTALLYSIVDTFIRASV